MKPTRSIELLPANQALLLEFLSAEESERLRIAAELRTLLDRQRDSGTYSSGSIPCRRPLGLIVLLSRPLALWLVAALERPSALSSAIENSLSRNRVLWGEEVKEKTA